MKNTLENKYVSKSREIAIKPFKNNLTKYEWGILYYILYSFKEKYFSFNTKEMEINNIQTYSLKIDYLTIEREMGLSNTRTSFDKAYENVFDFKYIQKHDKTVTTFTHLFSKTKIDEKNRIYELFFEKSLVEHLLDVKDNFVLLNLASVKKFSSKYTIPFYDYLKAKSTTQINLTVSVEKIKTLLHVEGYKVFANLKNRVLVPVFRDLKETDLKNIKITYIKKQTRKITHLTFKGKVSQSTSKYKWNISD